MKNVYLLSKELEALDRKTHELNWAVSLPVAAGGLSALIDPEAAWVFTSRGIYELSKTNGDIVNIFRGSDLTSLGGAIDLDNGLVICVSNQAVTAYSTKADKTVKPAKNEKASSLITENIQSSNTEFNMSGISCLIQRVVFFNLALVLSWGLCSHSVAAAEGGGITVVGVGSVEAKPSVVELTGMIIGQGQLAGDAVTKFHGNRRRAETAFKNLNIPGLEVVEEGVTLYSALSTSQMQAMMRGMAVNIRSHRSYRFRRL